MSSFFLMTASQSTNTSVFRVLPYLQVYGQGKFQLSWITNDSNSSNIELYDDQGNLIFSESTSPILMEEVFYTSVERNESISGLNNGSWLLADQGYKHQIVFPELEPGAAYTYLVKASGSNYSSSFRSVPDKQNWQSLRFIALSDSETEPEGRVVRRAWYPRNLTDFRPSSSTGLWKDKFGVTNDNGFQILNYPLTEETGYQENLKIINQRAPEFLLMPGDLVQGGGYQPAWDEFFRQNAGELGAGLSFYPIIPAIGNWENFGAINGGYGFNEKGDFLPKLGRERFQAYFETPTSDPLQKHQQSYYRVDYGPVTILTLDSSNGTPEDRRSDTPNDQKLENQEYSGPGTDTQENFTQAEYETNGGTDLSSFGNGSDQYQWLEENLTEAKEAGQLIFVQFHHSPFSSGEHGVPMNHELSTGQGGTPMRLYHPLFEEAGVIAVLAGHDELFERSFVDEDNDGTGVLYYDVGVAGDGLRGEKRNLTNDPTSLLNYNSFKNWTADQNSPEQWDESGPNPQLIDGGKHYGHLEVNLERVSEGNDTFAKIKFSPVYAFPVLDQNYDLQRVERRVYADEVELKILLESSDFIPEFRDSVAIFLDDVEISGDGIFKNFSSKAYLTPEDFLVEMPDEEFEFNSARGFEFNCNDTGLNQFQVSATNIRTGEFWVHDLNLYVLDTIAPMFEMYDAYVDFDPLQGSYNLNSFEFDLMVFYDNCPTAYESELSLSSITCEDIGWREGEARFEVTATLTDLSGNRSGTERAAVNVRFLPSDTISLQAKSPLYEGFSTELELGNEYDYEVLNWYGPNGIIPGAKGRNIVVEEPGFYFAEIITDSGCPLISDRILVNEEEVPFPPVKEDIIIPIDETGVASIGPEDLFETWPPGEELNVIVSPNELNCESIGIQELNIVITDSNENSWDLVLSVLVQDNIPPTLETKDLEIVLDRVTGSMTLDPQDFVVELTDNCEVDELTISKTEVSCEDIGQEIVVELRAVDLSGNVTERSAILTVTDNVSTTVTISGELEICQGQSTTLTVDSEASFEVVEWRQNGDPLDGETEKTLEVDEVGSYDVLIRFEGGCLWEADVVTVTQNELPSGEIERDGFVLVAPAGELTYQWFRNEEKIEGAADQEYEVTQAGIYTVQITSNSGCEKILNPVEFTEADFDNPFPPVKQEIILTLNASGQVELTPEDAFSSWPPADPDLEITFSQSVFDCEDIGESIAIVIRIENEEGEVWERLSTVVVQDDLPPVLVLRDLELAFDLVSGELTLSADDFIVEVMDNCEISEVIINQSVYTCEDLGGPIEVEIIARDQFENQSVETATLILIPTASSPVEISGNVNLCEGEIAEIQLDSDAAFEVIRWRRDGEEIPNERDKVLVTNVPAVYHAVIRYEGGCIAETQEIEVQVQSLPEGEIEEDGNILRAPEGDFDYQWFRNDEAIPGATNRVLTVDSMGEYTVELTTSFGCLIRLEPVVLTISGIGGRPVIEPKSLEIYPNPGAGIVQVKLEGDAGFTLSSFEIFSQVGREVSDLVQISQKSKTDFELQISQLPQGMYMIWLRGDRQELYFGKLIKK